MRIRPPAIHAQAITNAVTFVDAAGIRHSAAARSEIFDNRLAAVLSRDASSYTTDDWTELAGLVEHHRDKFDQWLADHVTADQGRTVNYTLDSRSDVFSRHITGGLAGSATSHLLGILKLGTMGGTAASHEQALHHLHALQSALRAGPPSMEDWARLHALVDADMEVRPGWLGTDGLGVLETKVADWLETRGIAGLLPESGMSDIGRRMLVRAAVGDPAATSIAADERVAAQFLVRDGAEATREEVLALYRLLYVADEDGQQLLGPATRFQDGWQVRGDRSEKELAGLMFRDDSKTRIDLSGTQMEQDILTQTAATRVTPATPDQLLASTPYSWGQADWQALVGLHESRLLDDSHPLMQISPDAISHGLSSVQSMEGVEALTRADASLNGSTLDIDRLAEKLNLVARSVGPDDRNNRILSGVLTDMLDSLESLTPAGDMERELMESVQSRLRTAIAVIERIEPGQGYLNFPDFQELGAAAADLEILQTLGRLE